MAFDERAALDRSWEARRSGEHFAAGAGLAAEVPRGSPGRVALSSTLANSENSSASSTA